MMIVHLVGGYYIAVVIAGGVPSWPQAARVLLALLTNMILSYEFVYKPAMDCSPRYAIRRVVMVSLIPFFIGIACVMTLFIL